MNFQKSLLLLSLIILNFACQNQENSQEQKEETTQDVYQTEQAYYTEPHRPQFHFSPAEKWMNDPNGMVYYENEYHLFYQYYPDSNVWGPMHWGHAISQDLVTWEHLPVALYPDSLGYIFSGSAVIDWNNTSGFGQAEQPAMVAIYTYHDPVGEKEKRDDFQTQGIAYSLDKGRTWTKYENNPVIPNPGIRDFRDPKVFWHAQTEKWIMILASGDHVKIYTSANLKEWELVSEFGKNQGSHGGVWECPDLFELAVQGTKKSKWVMIVSLGDGAPNGGSGTQYFIGDFDGEKFTNANDSEKILWLDYGRDNYAGVTWSDIPENDGRRIFIGWMSNWKYATKVPTDTWRSAMTLTRNLFLKETRQGLRLCSLPVKEFANVQNESKSLDTQTFSNELSLNDLLAKNDGLLEINLVLEFDTAQSQDFGLRFSNSTTESMSIGFSNEDGGTVYTDRSKAGKSGFDEGFATRHTAPRMSNNNEIKLKVILDVSSIELFVDEGEIVMTDVFFPNEKFSNVTLFSKEEVKLKEGTITSLRSIWDKVQ